MICVKLVKRLVISYNMILETVKSFCGVEWS